jgi:hypothetical protein
MSVISGEAISKTASTSRMISSVCSTSRIRLQVIGKLLRIAHRNGLVANQLEHILNSGARVNHMRFSTILRFPGAEGSRCAAVDL